MIDGNSAHVAQREVGIGIQRKGGRTAAHCRGMRAARRATNLKPTAGNIHGFAESDCDVRISRDIGRAVAGRRAAYGRRGVTASAWIEWGTGIAWVWGAGSEIRGIVIGLSTAAGASNISRGCTRRRGGAGFGTGGRGAVSDQIDNGGAGRTRAG